MARCCTDDSYCLITCHMMPLLIKNKKKTKKYKKLCVYPLYDLLVFVLTKTFHLDDASGFLDCRDQTCCGLGDRQRGVGVHCRERRGMGTRVATPCL